MVESRWRETLIFELAGRRFGVPASDVQELVRAVTITPLPPGAGTVEGVINLRGGIVPVFDLRARLGLSAAAAGLHESLVIVSRGGRVVAIRVDRPLELVTLDGEQIEPMVPSAGPSPPGSAGVARLADGLAVLLDPGDFLESSAWAWPTEAVGGEP